MRHISFLKVTLFPCPSSGLQIEFINPIFEFSKGMNDLHLDEAEYALLIAINIFSAGQYSQTIAKWKANVAPVKSDSLL